VNSLRSKYFKGNVLIFGVLCLLWVKISSCWEFMGILMNVSRDMVLVGEGSTLVLMLENILWVDLGSLGSNLFNLLLFLFGC
jgi:hypothetical protein